MISYLNAPLKEKRIRYRFCKILQRRNVQRPQYTKEFSKIDAHRNSFFPSVKRLYNKLPLEVRLCQDADKFADMIAKIDLVALKNSLTHID